MKYQYMYMMDISNKYITGKINDGKDENTSDRSTSVNVVEKILRKYAWFMSVDKYFYYTHRIAISDRQMFDRIFSDAVEAIKKEMINEIALSNLIQLRNKFDEYVIMYKPLQEARYKELISRYATDLEGDVGEVDDWENQIDQDYSDNDLHTEPDIEQDQNQREVMFTTNTTLHDIDEADE